MLGVIVCLTRCGRRSSCSRDWAARAGASAPGRAGRKAKAAARVSTEIQDRFGTNWQSVGNRGLHGTGIREVFGIDVREAEIEAFWTNLEARGLAGGRHRAAMRSKGSGPRLRVLGCRCHGAVLGDMLGQRGRPQQPMT